MSRGLGTAGVRENKKPIVPAPTVTAANDGVSLTGTTVKLGQPAGSNAANLTEARNIPLNGFPLAVINTDAGAKKAFLLDQITGQYQIGDINTLNQGTFLNINDGAPRAQVKSGGSRWLDLNISGDTYAMGDIDKIYTPGNRLSLGLEVGFTGILQSRNTIIGEYDGGGTYLNTNGSTTRTIVGYSQGHYGLVLDFANESYSMGDVLDSNGGLSFSLHGLGIVSPTTATIRETFTNHRFFDIDSTNSTYQIGDIDAAGNGTYLKINDGAPKSLDLYAGDRTGTNDFAELILDPNGMNFYTQGAAGTPVSQFQVHHGTIQFDYDTTFVAENYTTGGRQLYLSSGLFQLGDIDNAGNGTVYSIVDNRKGHNFSNVQDFANNAAAVAGGLVAGDLFKTVVAGEATLKIVQ